MGERYNKSDTIKGVITIVSLLSIPTLVVRDRIKKIRIEEAEKKAIDKIVRNTIDLEKNLTSEKAEKYIEFIKKLNVPNKVVCKNIILNGYDIITSDSNIGEDLKRKFRDVLEAKGFRIIC